MQLSPLTWPYLVNQTTQKDLFLAYFFVMFSMLSFLLLMLHWHNVILGDS
jgi:hypothetical protein